MVLYNVTVVIDHEIEKEWLNWMKNTHVPEVIATNCFAECKIMRLLDPPPDENGVTYAFQYYCKDMKTLQHYWERVCTGTASRPYGALQRPVCGLSNSNGIGLIGKVFEFRVSSQRIFANKYLTNNLRIHVF